MKPLLNPRTASPSLPTCRALQYVSMWLLSMVLAFGLVLGQSAEAGSVQVHHPGLSIKSAGTSGQETVPAPACHPGLTCTAAVTPEGPVTAMSLSIVIVLRPDLTQSQRRFGGPTVTLPPPRPLT